MGWVFGTLLALPTGYVIGRWAGLERALGPYLAATQAMPIIAVAPLLFIFVGLGTEPKVIIAALISFFPVMATTTAGIRGVDRDRRDVARVFGAAWWQMIAYVEAPQAARSIFAGAKIAAALAVAGALVGEYLNPDQGLGALVIQGIQNFDSPLVFVAVISSMGLGAAAYALVGFVERIVLVWTE